MSPIVRTAAAGLLAAAVAASSAGADEAAEKAAVQAAVDRMSAAFQADDIDGVLAAYEPGAVVVGDPKAPAQGEAALRTLFEEFAAVSPAFTFLDHEIILAGDIALHLTPWRMTGTAPDGGRIEDGGLSVVVLRRDAEGVWRMVVDHPYGDAILRRAE